MRQSVAVDHGSSQEISCFQRNHTSTIVLRVIRGDGKGTLWSGVYLGHSVPGGYKYGDLAFQVGGVSRIGAIKYGLEFCGTVLARTSSNSKLQTRPLVREGATK
jgi:hypothetical protein